MRKARPQASAAAGYRRRALVLGFAVSLMALAVTVKLPLCPMASLLGIPCPGCGLSRAAVALLHGHYAEAYRFHPLVFALLPLLGVGFASLAVSYVFGVRTPTGGPPDWRGGNADPARATRLSRVEWFVSGIGLVCLVAMLSVWILRFMGYLGGPVPVTNLLDWGRRLSH